MHSRSSYSNRVVLCILLASIYAYCSMHNMHTRVVVCICILCILLLLEYAYSSGSSCWYWSTRVCIRARPWRRQINYTANHIPPSPPGLNDQMRSYVIERIFLTPWQRGACIRCFCTRFCHPRKAARLPPDLSSQTIYFIPKLLSYHACEFGSSEWVQRINVGCCKSFCDP